MLHDVEQQLAHRLVQEEPHGFGLRLDVGLGLELDDEAVRSAHLAAQPVQAGDEALLLQRGRAQLVRVRAAEIASSRMPVTRSTVPRSRRPLTVARLNVAATEELLEVVMEDPGQPQALAVLGLAEFRREGAQLAGGLWGVLPRLVALDLRPEGDDTEGHVLGEFQEQSRLLLVERVGAVGVDRQRPEGLAVGHEGQGNRGSVAALERLSPPGRHVRIREVVAAEARGACLHAAIGRSAVGVSPITLCRRPDPSSHPSAAIGRIAVAAFRSAYPTQAMPYPPRSRMTRQISRMSPSSEVARTST